MIYFKALVVFGQRHISDRFGFQFGHEQIRPSNWSSSNYDVVNLVVIDAFSLSKFIALHWINVDPT